MYYITIIMSKKYYLDIDEVLKEELNIYQIEEDSALEFDNSNKELLTEGDNPEVRNFSGVMNYSRLAITSLSLAISLALQSQEYMSEDSLVFQTLYKKGLLKEVK